MQVCSRALLPYTMLLELRFNTIATVGFAFYCIDEIGGEVVREFEVSKEL